MYDSVGVRANHPRDACCGRGSASSVHPRWEDRVLRLQPMGQSDDQHAEKYDTELED